MNSVDELLELKPTLVIGSVPYKQETIAKLLEHPLNFLAMNPRTLRDIESDIRMLGRVVGRLPQAERFIRKMRQEFSAISKKAGKKKRKTRVYCEAWPNPRISSPCWVSEIVKICGGEMVLPSGQKVTDEQVSEALPEIIVLAWTATGDKAGTRQTFQVTAWKDLPAIRDKRVCVISDELLNTPGPPLVQGAKQLFRLLDPVAPERRDK